MPLRRDLLASLTIAVLVPPFVSATPRLNTLSTTAAPKPPSDEGGGKIEDFAGGRDLLSISCAQRNSFVSLPQSRCRSTAPSSEGAKGAAGVEDAYLRLPRARMRHRNDML